MKVTPRFGLDLTHTITHVLIENENEVSLIGGKGAPIRNSPSAWRTYRR